MSASQPQTSSLANLKPLLDHSSIPSTTGTINYAKPRKDMEALQHPDSGLAQGGEFMANSQKANPANKKNLDVQEMRVYDARTVREQLDIDTHGFQVETLNTTMDETLENLFEDKEATIRSVYWPELCELAKQAVVSDGRRPKYVFCLGTQKFTEDKSRGLLGSYSRSAHADFADVVFDRAYKMLTKRGVSEEEATKMDLMFVNAWKPFGRAVADNPLTILDWSSVDPSRDVHGLPRGAPVVKGNILASTVTFNPGHK